VYTLSINMYIILNNYNYLFKYKYKLLVSDTIFNNMSESLG